MPVRRIHDNTTFNHVEVRCKNISNGKRSPGEDSLKTKRMQAAWSEKFRLEILQGFPVN